jgi:dTMP kinase
LNVGSIRGIPARGINPVLEGVVEGWAREAMIFPAATGGSADLGHSTKNVVFPTRVPSLVLTMTKTFAELKFPGRLIAVEGLDGSGKSTQIYLLKRWLELQGLKVFFSEWNSSDLVKAATSKGKKRELLSPTTFSLIHATDFADRYERQLLPLLQAGYVVLCDRYIFTAFARDVVRGCAPEWVRGIYSFAALPDFTFFFRADLEVSLHRILDGRPQLKYFEAGMDLHLSGDPYESFRIFQGRILEQYLAMSTEFNFLVIDANQPIEAQQSLVRELLASKIDLSGFSAEHSHARAAAAAA